VLTICLPKPSARTTDVCRINGADARFRIKDFVFEYRHEGDAGWTRRYIVFCGETTNDLVQYVCTDEDAPAALVGEMRDMLAMGGVEASLDPVVLGRFSTICLKTLEHYETGLVRA
jgi:hypothetical protein